MSLTALKTNGRTDGRMLIQNQAVEIGREFRIPWNRSCFCRGQIYVSRLKHSSTNNNEKKAELTTSNLFS